MLESQKSMEFDPGAAIEAHKSLMATLNLKFWEVGAGGRRCRLARGPRPPTHAAAPAATRRPGHAPWPRAALAPRPPWPRARPALLLLEPCAAAPCPPPLQRCKTRKAWRGGKAAMFEEEEFKHQVAQALQVPDNSIAAKKLYIAVADMLLHPSTLLPLDSSTLHKKVRAGSASGPGGMLLRRPAACWQVHGAARHGAARHGAARHGAARGAARPSPPACQPRSQPPRRHPCPAPAPSAPPQLSKLTRRGEYQELLDSMGQPNIDWVLIRMAQQSYIELLHHELDQRLRLVVVAASRPMLCQWVAPLRCCAAAPLRCVAWYTCQGRGLRAAWPHGRQQEAWVPAAPAAVAACPCAAPLPPSPPLPGWRASGTLWRCGSRRARLLLLRRRWRHSSSSRRSSSSRQRLRHWRSRRCSRGWWRPRRP
jgi:hypothetical protein